MDLSSIMNIGIKKVLDRGTAIILEENETSIFVKDTVSNVYLLGTNDVKLGIEWLKQHEDEKYELIQVFDERLADYMLEEYGFKTKFECFQGAYLKEEAPELLGILSVENAELEDMKVIRENYQLISEEEMKEVIERKNLYLAYVKDELVGFIGEHLEGSMGMLYIYPEHRKKGYAMELEKLMIEKTRKQGYIPFCQVEINNQDSMNLQKKLGFTISNESLYWVY